MTRLILIILASLLVASASATEGNFLNVALLELPARYLADLPEDQRALFLVRLSEDPNEKRLDYQHGWVHWFTDSGELPHLTSMLYLKLLPRGNNTPLVFVHMPKPYADGSTPRKNQTFVLERVGREWRDVTSRVIPKEVDLTLHFQPHRSKQIVEVAAYERFERQDGRGHAYRFGERRLDLIWNGASFEARKPSALKLSNGN